MFLGKSINNIFDSLVRLEVHALQRSWHAFKVCGYTGLVLAVLLAIGMAAHLRLSLWVLIVIVAAAVVTFFALVMATKIITGEERIIYYHHEIAVMIVAAIALWLMRQPILPYLDVTILGIGVFLACGRMGCLMVGCCHGRPYHWGVHYKQEHADAGFTPYYVGLRLFPIQAVESFWVLSTVTVGSFFVLGGYPSGTALAWYVIAYDVGRFCFEFMRGDPDRPYLWGYSQPQWISLLLMCLVVMAELSGVLPFHMWHSIATACLMFAMIGITLRRHFQVTATHRLLHPHHIREVADALELLREPPEQQTVRCGWTVLPSQDDVTIRIGSTSLGVQISAGKVRGAKGDVCHYTVSYRHGGMTEEVARLLARLILKLKLADGEGELLQGEQGVFHLLINREPGRSSPSEAQAKLHADDHRSGSADSREPFTLSAGPDGSLLPAFWLRRQSQSPNWGHNK
jgi:Prolipoprotein diacylglyceryl transferase